MLAWPDDLEAVAKEFGPIPVDPPTGEPFRYRKTEQSFELEAEDLFNPEPASQPATEAATAPAPLPTPNT